MLGGFLPFTAFWWKWSHGGVDTKAAATKFTLLIAAWGTMMIAASLVDVFMKGYARLSLSASPGAIGVIFVLSGLGLHRNFVRLRKG
jgi:hypothetical protein